MIELLIVLGSILGYFGIGAAAMRFMLPTLWRTQIEANRRYSTLGYEYARTDVQIWAWITILFWPFVLPIALVRGVVIRMIDQTDPIKLEETIKERDRRIRQLERELFGR